MINNGMIVNDNFISFNEFYNLEEGIFDRMKDVKNSVVYFTKKFYYLFKSKNKKEGLIQILKEMKQDYQEYYKGFMGDVYNIIYPLKGKVKRDKEFREDIIIFFMVVLSIVMVIPSLKLLNSIISPEEFMKKVMEHKEKVESEVKDIQQKVEEDSVPKLDLTDLGGGIKFDPTK